MKPDIKQHWVAALESGDYEQGTSYLRCDGAPDPDQFCCLGVLCDLAVKVGAIPAPTVIGGDWTYGTVDDRNTLILPKAVVAWAGLETDSPTVDLDHPDDEGEVRAYELVQLNDEGMDFPKLAELIREQL